jgi:hypothetical protein
MALPIFWRAAELPSTETSPTGGAAYAGAMPEHAKVNISWAAKRRCKNEVFLKNFISCIPIW